jgi:hypothetical protein
MSLQAAQLVDERCLMRTTVAHSFTEKIALYFSQTMAALSRDERLDCFDIGYVADMEAILVKPWLAKGWWSLDSQISDP